jgi:hypothetical protein
MKQRETGFKPLLLGRMQLEPLPRGGADNVFVTIGEGEGDVVEAQKTSEKSNDNAPGGDMVGRCTLNKVDP